LGKISVVKSVAGKSRLIGITNYWIQVVLEPVHNAILKFIKNLETDGTYDQLAPIKRLIGREKHFSSLDLSAATDRLPLDFQRDVINLFFGKGIGNLWSDIISFPCFTGPLSKYVHNKKCISYEVGQPMGTYSSWASLALAHHVIVQMSSPKGVIVEDYAVLGDDIVIDDQFREKYVSLITGLGVEISLQKSLLTSHYVEFAKRIFDLREETEAYDLSIIGPKLILGSIKNPIHRISMLFEALRKGIIREYLVHDKLRSFSDKREYRSFGLWALFGLEGAARTELTSVPVDWFFLWKVFGRERFLKVAPKEFNVPLDPTIFDDRSIYIVYYRLVVKKYRGLIVDALTNIRSLVWPILWTFSVDRFISYLLLVLSPFSWIIIRDNSKVVYESLHILFRLYYIKCQEDYPELTELARMLHPTLVGTRVEENELAKTNFSLIKKIHYEYIDTMVRINLGVYPKQIDKFLALRDQTFKDLISKYL
jgi:hypothetical protein